MELRKLIREIIEDAMDLRGEKFNKNLQDKIDFLKGFQFKEYKENGEKEAWKFYKYEGETVFSAIIIKEGPDLWKFKLNINGKLNKGGLKEIGPMNGFLSFSYEIDKCLENNPILNPENFNDDLEDDKIKIIQKFIHELKHKAKILRIINSENLNDLKDIYNFIESKPEMAMEKIIDILEDQYENLDNLLLVLQKVEKIDFYKKMEEQ